MILELFEVHDPASARIVVHLRFDSAVALTMPETLIYLEVIE